MHDSQAARAEFALDLVLPFCAAGESSHIQALKIKNSANSFTATKVKLSFIDWQSDFGGSTCYVANEEDEEVGADLSIKLDVSIIFPSMLIGFPSLHSF